MSVNSQRHEEVHSDEEKDEKECRDETETNSQKQVIVSCAGKVKALLQSLSFGKYESPLYFKGEDLQSSALGGIITLLGITIIVIFAANILLGIINKEKYQIDIQTKSVIFELFDLKSQKLLDQYICDKQIYRSLQEAKLNPNCIEFTIEDLISVFPVHVQYQTFNRSQNDLCDEKFIVFALIDKNAQISQITIRYGSNQDKYSNDTCYFKFNFQKDQLFDKVKAAGRLNEAAFYVAKEAALNSIAKDYQTNLLSISKILISLTYPEQESITVATSETQYQENGEIFKTAIQRIGLGYSKITLNLKFYESTDSIWSFIPFLKPQTSKKTTQTEKIQSDGSNDGSIISLELYNNADYIFRTPTSLVQGLTQIGGFLPILKFTMMLRIIHRSQFKKTIKKEFQTCDQPLQQKKIYLQNDLQTQQSECLNDNSSFRTSFLETQEPQENDPAQIFTFERFKMMSDQIVLMSEQIQSLTQSNNYLMSQIHQIKDHQKYD